MPQELLDKLFCSKIDEESNEDLITRKQNYNNEIMKKIKNIKFTEKQVMILDYLFNKDMTLTDIAKLLNVRIQTVSKIKDEAIAKIRKKIVYNFKYNNLET